MEQKQETTLAQYGKQQSSITVSENTHYRSLYFQKDILQSKMDRSAPQRLCLSYTEYMILPLLFEKEICPQHILIIGVGGGSFVRFFQKHYSSAKIVGVEYSQQILDIAQQHFLVTENPTTTIVCDCGRTYLENCTDKFDLILVDAFDHRGMADSIYSSEFFTLCANHLTKDGVVSCNTWSGDSQLSEHLFEIFQDNFDDSIHCPVPERGNIILLGFKQQVPWGRLHPRNPFLLEKERQLEIDFTKMVTVARRANIPLWKRLLL